MQLKRDKAQEPGLQKAPDQVPRDKNIQTEDERKVPPIQGPDFLWISCLLKQCKSLTQKEEKKCVLY